MSIPYHLIRAKPPTPPPAKVIAVDIDGTLEIDGLKNDRLLIWLEAKRQQGYRLMLWSARGYDYTQQKADVLGIRALFDDIVSKPGYIIDDQGWRWTQYTKAIDPDSITSTISEADSESVKMRRT